MSELARSGGELAGRWCLHELTRLSETAPDPTPEGFDPESVSARSGGAADAVELPAAREVRWKASGWQVERIGASPQIWLHLEARVRLTLQCQRCLGPVEVEIEVDRDFRFVLGEEEAALEDEHSDEDVLSLTRELDLRELIEDELILSLPVVPKHARCPSSPALGANDPGASAGPGPAAGPQETHRPFEVLAALKARRSDTD